MCLTPWVMAPSIAVAASSDPVVAPPTRGAGVLVRLRPSVPSGAAEEIASDHGVTHVGPVEATGFVLISSGERTPETVARELGRDPRVELAEPNQVRRVAAVPNDPYFPSQAANLGLVRLPEAWDMTAGADGLTLAVIDTGVRASQPELAGRVLPGRDFVNGDDDADDDHGHGTQVATVAAAAGNDGAGMAGVAWRGRILPVKVVDQKGNTTDAAVAAGIRWAVEQSAHVLNLSFGGPQYPTAIIREAIEYAHAHNVVIAASAGNTGRSQPIYPAALDGVVAVSATDQRGHFAGFSDSGPWVDVAAPGVGVIVGARDGSLRVAEGTSFAAPVVAGVAMLARARFPGETADQIVQRIRLGASDTGPLGPDDLYGYGVVDAVGALGGTPRRLPADPALMVDEPNDTPDRGTPIAVGDRITGQLAHHRDIDWYSVDISTERRHAFTLSSPGGADGIDPVLAIYDPELRLLQQLGGDRDGKAEVTLTATPGRYQVRVQSRVGTTRVGPYDFRVRTPDGPNLPAPVPTGQHWVRDTFPAEGSTEVAAGAQPRLRLSLPLDPASVTTASVALTDTLTGQPVATSLTYDAATNEVVIRPDAPLTAYRTYQVTVTDLRSLSGETIPSDTAYSYRFAVAETPPDPPVIPSSPSGVTPPPPVASASSGYWLVDGVGAVYAFGEAAHLGNAATGAVDLEPSPTGRGYWILNKNGAVSAFGDAMRLGDVGMGGLAKGELPASLSATQTGKGYWVFTNRGRAIAFGDAVFLGDMSATRLNGPVLGSVATPSGKGYYMVASDGGIFAFGDAAFAGSMGGKELNAAVQSLVPDADGKGYWLVASDGGIFAFDAPFRGSMGATRLNKPVVGMVRFGDGYLMVAADGGIFNFSSLPFAGSLGDKPPAAPVVAVAALP